MRYIAVAFLFCLSSSIANAQAFQSEKPVICDKTKNVIEFLTSRYNEKPIWTGKDARDETRYSLFVNSKTGSWTLLQMTPEYACLLGIGDNSKLILGASL